MYQYTTYLLYVESKNRNKGEEEKQMKMKINPDDDLRKNNDKGFKY